MDGPRLFMEGKTLCGVFGFVVCPVCMSVCVCVCVCVCETKVQVRREGVGQWFLKCALTLTSLPGRIRPKCVCVCVCI